jgi:aminopeptidase N
LRVAVGTGSESRVGQLFARRADAKELFDMAAKRGGLRSIKVTVVPAPPGWKSAPYWAVFHTYQDIEAEHDPVYEVLPTMTGFNLGKEVPEKSAGFNRITHAEVSASIAEKDHRIQVKSNLTLQGTASGQATVFRLNDIYKLSSASVDGMEAEVVTATDTAVPELEDGQVLRAGSLLVPWTSKPVSRASFTYEGEINTPNEDKINTKMCYVTAWLVPSTARLPHTTQVKVEGPAGWELRSEGVLKNQTVSGDRQTVEYRCDLPISYPKIVGGAYALAASKTDRGRLFRAYQFPPIDSAKGQTTVDLAAKAVAWFEDNLGPFPFPGYDAFDAEGYYGIESYSYTLLEKSITNRFVSHEIGHTYFGGLAPSAYVEDSWNEGMTQYVDSVLYLQNADRSLQYGMESTRLHVPLTAIPAPHDHGSQSYYRGAFVMRMLENEIGTPTMMKCLRAIVSERRGQDTTWSNLLPLFEKVSGLKLDWFWKQWIAGSQFPKLRIASWKTERWNDKLQTRVTVRQNGTEQPFRLRFKIRATRGPESTEQVVKMTSREAVFNVPVEFEPDTVKLDVFGLALVDVE